MPCTTTIAHHWIIEQGCHNGIMLIDCGNEPWMWTDSMGCCMTQQMADENFQMYQGVSKKSCGLNIFLVKLTLQIGNQHCHNFTNCTPSNIPIKIPYYCKIYNLLNSQPQSYQMQTGPLSNKYKIQHDIMAHLMFM